MLSGCHSYAVYISATMESFPTILVAFTFLLPVMVNIGFPAVAMKSHLQLFKKSGYI
jgi:hypothetical protein